MGNRKLYNEKKFLVDEVLEWDGETRVWHLEGHFEYGSIKSIYKTGYRIRIKPDPRWKGVRVVRFRTDYVYENQSGRTGRWYISPFRKLEKIEFGGSSFSSSGPNKFVFEDFDVP